MKTFHIVNGDCLAQDFPNEISGEIIPFRECLIVGPKEQENFFEKRAEFIVENYNSNRENYQLLVVNEFSKIKQIPENSKIYFWFEDDLFCQANFWFLLSQITCNQLFRVKPMKNGTHFPFGGFGGATAQDLIFSFENAVPITENDHLLGKDLWKTFSIKNLSKLENLMQIETPVFPCLKELFAAIEQLWSKKVERQIFEHFKVSKNEKETVLWFLQNFSVYGFGDSQILQILKGKAI